MGLGVGLIGAYFIAAMGFMTILKSSVTHGKLIGFVTTFSISFLLIFGTICWIIGSNFQFGR